MTAADVVDTNTGEVFLEANQELTSDKLHKIQEAGISSIEVFFPERDDMGNVITNTLRRDSVRKPEEALIEIYRKLRPAIRRPSTPRPRSSKACSSMRASMTSRASAGSSSTSSSTRIRTRPRSITAP